MRSREFLTTIGLPEFFDWPPYEFGVYDSKFPDLVIGEVTSQPILIEATSGIVFFDSEPPPRRYFLNSSVELLSRFLYLVSDYQHTPDDDDAVRHAFAHMRAEMLALDPTAMAGADSCVWAHWLAEWQSELPDFNHNNEPNVA